MNGSYFYILSIDGGGIRGIFPAHILKCIQNRFEIKLLDYFKMIAGTSTGSIIAAAIVCGVDLEKVVNLYKKHGNSIFLKNKSFVPKRFDSACQSRYDKNNLFSLLEDVFGNIKLGEIPTPLLIPATDIGNGGVHVFKSGYSKEFVRDKDVILRDAVIASCSAPTYFDPTKGSRIPAC